MGHTRKVWLQKPRVHPPNRSPHGIYAIPYDDKFRSSTVEREKARSARNWRKGDKRIVRGIDDLLEILENVYLVFPGER